MVGGVLPGARQVLWARRTRLEMLDSYPGVSHARTSGETVIPAASLRFSPAASAVLAVTGTPLPSASSFRRPSSRAKDSTTRAYFRSHPEDHVAPSRTDPPPSRRNHRPPRPTTAGTSCSQHFLLCFRARFVLFPPLSWSLSGFHRGSPLPKHIDPDRWWRRPRVLELRREGGLPLLWVLQERAARGSRRRLLRNLWPGPSIQYKTQQLRREVQRLQKKLHPDLVHSKSEKERAFAAEQSALVIDAYRTLNKPLPRALYMLQLEGIHVDEEKTINDPELLMEMMEIREAVSEASDSQTLGKIQSQMKRKLETWEKSFEEAFKKRDFDHAVEATQRMRYYERAMEETVKKL